MAAVWPQGLACIERAIGGREKSHRTDSPATLRIIVRVEFDPNADAPKSEAMAERLVALAKAHHDVTQYDRVEVHLEQRVPEAATRHWSESRPVGEWRESPVTKVQ